MERQLKGESKPRRAEGRRVNERGLSPVAEIKTRARKWQCEVNGKKKRNALKRAASPAGRQPTGPRLSAVRAYLRTQRRTASRSLSGNRRTGVQRRGANDDRKRR